MILRALADYYVRLRDDSGCDVAPPGFEKKALPFLIVINHEGRFINIRDTRAVEGKKKAAREFLVPKGEKKTSGIKANILWDNPQYVLKVPKGESEKDKIRAENAFEAFKKRLDDTFKGFNDVGVDAVKSFLSGKNFLPIFNHELWQEIKGSNANISFMLEKEAGLIVQRKNVVQHINGFLRPFGKLQACAVTGKEDVPALLHTVIKGVWGAQSSGANIVSFNLDAFRSFGKKQGYNAPVGQKAEFAYTTALNYLLASERQRMQVGDASTVFWGREECSLESDFPDYLSPKKGEEAVSYGKIRSLLQAVKSGVPPEKGDMSFYVLGLAPNASRIAVRFWYDGSVKEIKERIAKHFEDVAVLPGPNDPEFLSLPQLLLSVVPLKESNRSKKIPPNLGGDIIRAVLGGTLYPRTLLANAILRSKAEQKVTYARAAVIKGCLARTARIKKSPQKEVTMALDKNYSNIGYVLGRLFAVLERIQEQAQGRSLNKTIRDTYFSSAASSPVVTFKRLNDLSIHHLAKIRNSGKSTVWLEQLVQEVSCHIPPQGYPTALNLEDQGRFSIGYYHQRQDFFTKKNDEKKGDA